MAATVTPRPVQVFLGVALAVVAAGIALLVRSTAAYLADRRDVSSTSGDYVYRYEGQQFGYPAFVVGPEPMLIAAGLVLTIVAITIAALTWRPAE